MNTAIRYLKSNASLLIRYICGSWPGIYYPLFAKRIGSPVKSGTNICIEGFMGSANTLSIYCIKQSNLLINIAHHHHVIAQIKESINLNVPVLVLIRKPEDAILSTISNNTALNITLLMKFYIKFYKYVLSQHPGSLILCKFESVTTDFNRIVNTYNDHYTDGIKLKLISDVEDLINKFIIGRKHDKTIPSYRRTAIKSEYKKCVEQNKLLSKASDLYTKNLEKHITA